MKSGRAVADCEGPQRSHVQRTPRRFKICACYCSPRGPVPVGQLGTDRVTWGQSCLPRPHSSV